MKIKLCAILLSLLVLTSTCLAAKQDAITDDSLYNQVKIKLASDQVVKGGGLTIDVKDGVVTLGGSVELPQQKERAEKITKKTKGVKQVINNITIRK